MQNRSFLSSFIVLTAVVLGVATPTSATDQASGALDEILARGWEFRLQEYPLLATSVAVHDRDHLLADVSREAYQRRLTTWQNILAELDAIDTETLTDTDRINYDVFRRQIEDEIATIEFADYEIPFNADSGFQSGMASLPQSVPLATTEDYRNYIARLRAIAPYFDQHIDNMRAGLKRGMTQPREVLVGIEATASAHVVEDPTASVFYAPFEDFPVGVAESARQALIDTGSAAILESVVPAYAKLHDFFVEEYLPGVRPSGGASYLPNGDAYYQHRIRYYTTLDLTAEEIHQIGLNEVARIRSEMESVIQEVGFGGSFAEFLTFLRTDPQFYPESGEELLKQAAFLSKKMDGQLPRLFGHLPRLPYGVEPVPDHLAPKYTAGRYVGAPAGSTRPGYYWVNTYALDTRSLYNLEALTLHEAVPGHHLQSALAAEMENVPPFRRFEYISAFGEGWGLYSERLGLEAGFYTDPYSNFGRLTYEMWRACRLVIDTGLHAMGWSRKKAVRYLASNSALALHNVNTEIDRYISWPAQALSYKIGEHTIWQLRREAQQQLDQSFDIRAFHDFILSLGSVPLDVLRDEVQRWISDQSPGVP